VCGAAAAPAEPREKTEDEKAAEAEAAEEAKKKTFDQVMAERAKNKVVDDAKIKVREVDNDSKLFKAAEAHKKESIAMFDDSGKAGAKDAKEAPAKAKPAEKKDVRIEQESQRRSLLVRLWSLSPTHSRASRLRVWFLPRCAEAG
jgi:hypothetical protein